MTKRKLTLTISQDLLGEARNKNINLSSFSEIERRRYLALIQRKKNQERGQWAR
jgi:hypothetical protein